MIDYRKTRESFLKIIGISILVLAFQNCTSSTGVSDGQIASQSAGAKPTPISSTPNSTTIPTHCTSALPSGAQAADVSRPNTVIGNGTASSCTFAALNAAVTAGGVITFNCGASPVTIPITA